MTEDAGQIFKSLIDEYRSRQQKDLVEKTLPKPRYVGDLCMAPGAHQLFMCALDNKGELYWLPV
jgi:hypothetical protein